MLFWRVLFDKRLCDARECMVSFFMALFLMLALVVVWVYALVDMIIGEVRPLREEKNEQ